MNEFIGQLVTPEQAASLIGVEPEMVYRLMADDGVRFLQVGSGEDVEYKLPLQGFLNNITKIEGIDLEADVEALRRAAETIDPSIDVLDRMYRSDAEES